MVINGLDSDRHEFTVDGVTVKHTFSYIYLGSPFTEDANLNTVIKLHVKSKMSDLNKFMIFCRKNKTMPYKFKKQVLEGMILASLLYACESWLSVSVKEVEKVYISAVKSLLGVRGTTRSDTIMIQSGMPLISERITKRTAAFLKKKLHGDHADETPLQKIYKICEAKQTRGYKFLQQLLTPTLVLPSLPEKFANEQGTKAVTYRSINPGLKVHPVYLSNEYINERARITFSRFRLSSHSLKVETGRWSRIDENERLCECGSGVQDESHVLLVCPKTEVVRQKFNVNTTVMNDIGTLMDSLDVNMLIPFVDCVGRNGRNFTHDYREA